MPLCFCGCERPRTGRSQYFSPSCAVRVHRSRRAKAETAKRAVKRMTVEEAQERARRRRRSVADCDRLFGELLANLREHLAAVELRLDELTEELDEHTRRARDAAHPAVAAPGEEAPPAEYLALVGDSDAI